MTYKNQNLQVATEQAMPVFARDSNMTKYFKSKDEEIGEVEEVPNSNRYIDEIDQYYNNKKIIDRMGAEKDSNSPSTDKEDVVKELPFLAGQGIEKEDILSPHADTLDIGDLEDVESVKSDRSD